MTKLETIISENPELVKAATREYLSKHHCPREFGLPEKGCKEMLQSECGICWNHALDDGRDEEP
jgi:hypothetical protein